MRTRKAGGGKARAHARLRLVTRERLPCVRHAKVATNNPCRALTIVLLVLQKPPLAPPFIIAVWNAKCDKIHKIDLSVLPQSIAVLPKSIVVLPKN